MIVLNVTYKCKPGMRKAFLDRIRTEGIDIASRAESGNFRYEYFLPVDGDDILLLMERWRDAEALAKHTRQPHFARLSDLKDDYIDNTEVDRFEVND
ncbi:MAG: antibiotic biosynthesis monooxygenase [Erysipelotrichaceae bacterium]|nr:antibiotic biosynthesis monooxygenase [Erysipelotrichaceae bacterium]MBQ6591741.1 antibiotic biosynthesis monooxygenase [Solobacterium sp.]